MKIKKAIIPVAGKGTRFLPVTKSVPKEMIPIINVPMLFYVVKEAVESGIEQIVFITSEGKGAIEHFFRPDKVLEQFLTNTKKAENIPEIQKFEQMAEFSFVNQNEQLGLGHAVLQAKNFIKADESFALLLGDDLTFHTPAVTKQLIDVSQKNKGASVIGVTEVPREQTRKYGVVDGQMLADQKTMKLNKMVEKPAPENAPSNFATPGRYIFNASIFDALAKISKGAGGEYQLTDAINILAEQTDVYAYLFDGQRIDTGTPEGYLEAVVDFALKDSQYRENFMETINKKLKLYGLKL